MLPKYVAYYLLTQKNKALAANAMITNPLYLLYSKHCGVLSDEEKDEWNERDVIVIDEAHNTEKHLIFFLKYIYHQSY